MDQKLLAWARAVKARRAKGRAGGKSSRSFGCLRMRTVCPTLALHGPLGAAGAGVVFRPEGVGDRRRWAGRLHASAGIRGLSWWSPVTSGWLMPCTPASISGRGGGRGACACRDG